MPNGAHVVRAFTLRNFLFYRVDGIVIAHKEVLVDQYLAIQTAQQYDIQKNRMNNQIIKQNRDLLTTHLCPVDIAINIVELATRLCAQNPEDPLGVFQTDSGDTVYLTGDMITKYYRYMTRIVCPIISDAELRLFSCHSARVMAAVLLHEAGKDGAYIKLRIRWLSDCFHVYLKNTQRICSQHTAALKDDNLLLASFAFTDNNIPALAICWRGANETAINLDDDD